MYYYICNYNFFSYSFKHKLVIYNIFEQMNAQKNMQTYEKKWKLFDFVNKSH
jgi:hypothetical protein